MGNDQRPSDQSEGVQDGLSQIGAGLKKAFGGLFNPQGAQTPTTSDREFITLRYGREEEIVESFGGDDLPTVAEAFEEYSGSLGLDPSRTCTYRRNGVVVSGDDVVQFGSDNEQSVYVASVNRSTKG